MRIIIISRRRGFGLLPEIPSPLYFKTRLTRLLQEKKEFIGIDELISMAEEGEFYPTQSGYAAYTVNRTLRSRLEALKLTGMVARDPLAASSFAGARRI